MLYIVYFLVPRFFNLPLREKLITIFHELYHVSPGFDGDIRRFPGRNYAHGASRKRYNAEMAGLVDGYLRKNRPGRLIFLKVTWRLFAPSSDHCRQKISRAEDSDSKLIPRRRFPQLFSKPSGEES